MAAPISDALPAAPSSSDSPDVFEEKAFSFVGALEPFRVDLQAQADFVNDNVGPGSDAEIVANIAADVTTVAGVADDVSLLAVGQVSKAELAALQSSTLAEAVASTSLRAGQAITISDRDNGVFDVVLASGVTTNTFNIIQCVGVPTLALKLRAANGVISGNQSGAVEGGVIDATAALIAAEATGNKVYISPGDYLVDGQIVGDYFSNGAVTTTGGTIKSVVNLLDRPKKVQIHPPIFAAAPRFAGLKNAFYTTIDTALFTYKAFPFFLVGNSKLNAFAWSSGTGHANSDEVIYAIFDSDTREFSKGTFYNLNTSTENLSWLEPYLEEGEYVNFRSVYTVIRESGTLNLYTTSSVDVSGDMYALWGTPILYDGDWYTTGYRSTGGYFRTILFKSTDKMKTWSSVSLYATNSARTYNEAAIINTSGSNFISVVRENTTGTRDLVLVSSANAGINWTPTPGTLLTPIPDVKGTQPFLLKLTNGDIMLIAGKRTGSSGVNAGGSLIDMEDITGVMYWITPDDGVTWGDGVQLAPSWSTDCGNPTAKQLDNGNVAVVFYTALGATNGTIGVEPSIIYLEFDPINTKSIA